MTNLKVEFIEIGVVKKESCGISGFEFLFFQFIYFSRVFDGISINIFIYNLDVSEGIRIFEIGCKGNKSIYIRIEVFSLFYYILSTLDPVYMLRNFIKILTVIFFSFFSGKKYNEMIF